MTYNLSGKNVIITGANAGIGKAAAIQLAQCGANVILGCRSMERGQQAVNEIKNSSGSKTVELMSIDLSSQRSIRAFASAFEKKYSRLDVLIHNAANFDQTQKQAVRTEDGIETIFATNHIGPFLLTHLLLPVLKASAPSRIITVASKGLIVYPFLDIEFDNLNGEKKFTAQHAYYLSKQAQVMFTYALAEHLTGSSVTANCVRVTSVAIPDERLTHLPNWQRKLYEIKRSKSITAERQAETYVYLAADPAAANISGSYWDENNQQVRSNKNSYNKETQAKLWEISEKMSSIKG